MSKNKDKDAELYFDGELENDSSNNGNDPNTPNKPPESDGNQPTDSNGSGSDNEGVSPDEMNDADNASSEANRDDIDNENDMQNSSSDDNSEDLSNDGESELGDDDSSSNITDNNDNNDDISSDGDSQNGENFDKDSGSDDSTRNEGIDGDRSNDLDSDPSANGLENDSGQNGLDSDDINNGVDNSDGSNFNDDLDQESSGTDPYMGSTDDSNSEVGQGEHLGTDPSLYNNDAGQSKDDSDADKEASGNKDDGFESGGKDKDGLDDGVTSNEDGKNSKEGGGGDRSQENSGSGKENENDQADLDADKTADNRGKDNNKNNDDDENGKDDQSGGNSQGELANDEESPSAIKKLAGKTEVGDAVNKGKRLKDLSKMKKEQAAKEGAELAKELAVKKVKYVVITALAPYVIPVIVGLLLLLMLILGIVAATTASKPADYVAQQCTENDAGGEDADSSGAKDSGSNAENAKATYIFLLENVKGLSKIQAAGILGALDQESGFSPTIVNPSSGAYGLAQWLGPRKEALDAFASKKGKKPSDLGLQHQYLLHEINGPYEHGQLQAQGFFEADSIEKATTAWSVGFERMGRDEANMGGRIAYAKNWYSKFKDIKVDTSKAKELNKGGSDDNISDATDAATDNSEGGEEACGDGEDSGYTGGEIGDSVKNNGGTGKIVPGLGPWEGKDAVPKKYRKYIKIPDFQQSFLNGSPFASSSSLRGQCTELTWAYMHEMWQNTSVTAGNGGVVYQSYKSGGAKITDKPTVGYGFSASQPYAGAGGSAGHTGVVAGVMPDGKWILANYNLRLEAPNRVLTYAVVDGNTKDGAIKFFSGTSRQPKAKYKK